MISMVLLFVLSVTHVNSESYLIVVVNNVTYLAIADNGEAGILILDSNSNAFGCSAGRCVKLVNLTELVAS